MEEPGPPSTIREAPKPGARGLRLDSDRVALAVGTVACVLSLPALRALPIFGTVLTGRAAAGAMLLFAAVSALLAVATFRRMTAAGGG
jgi:hypothetical protein